MPCDSHGVLNLSTAVTGPVSCRECLARPTEYEPSQPPVCPDPPRGLCVCTMYVACLIYLSVDRGASSSFLVLRPAGKEHGTRWEGGGVKKRSLAFRHKPPPAKDRSERWLPPRSRLVGVARGADWFETTHFRTNPDEGFPRAHQTSLGRGQPFLSLFRLSIFVPNVRRIGCTRCSKSSRQPPDGEWRPRDRELRKT